jgi:HSP20 family protein
MSDTEPSDEHEESTRDEAPPRPRERPRPGRRSSRPTGERSPEWPYAPSGGDSDGRRGALPRWGLQAHPDVDVAEHPDELHVWCDLPGCAEETIELSGDEWTLYVSAERAEAYWEEGGIQRRERSRRAERSIALPARTDVEAAEASFEDGVLFVRAPKHESERTQSIGFQ